VLADKLKLGSVTLNPIVSTAYDDVGFEDRFQGSNCGTGLGWEFRMGQVFLELEVGGSDFRQQTASAIFILQSSPRSSSPPPPSSQRYFDDWFTLQWKLPHFFIFKDSRGIRISQ
jgi:hypothetical protein